MPTANTRKVHTQTILCVAISLTFFEFLSKLCMSQMVTFSFNTLYQLLHACLALVLDSINEAHYLSIPGSFTLDALHLIIVQDLVLKQNWQKLFNIDQLLEERQVFVQQRNFQYKPTYIRSKRVLCTVICLLIYM